MFSDAINWKELGAECDALPLTANDSLSQQNLYKFFTLKLRKAGDKHSFFISKQALTARSEKPIEVKPEGDYLGDGIGWIKVPYCLTFETEKDASFAKIIREEIRRIDSLHIIKGWVIDLRHNTGGNMWPMLAGLSPLIESGTAGYFVDPKSKKKEAWTSQGKLYDLDDVKIKNNKVKLAVLIDSRTGSSGEMTAVSFLGLPNVRTFGQISAGYTTANYTFVLSNGAQLLLAMQYVSDRNGTPYTAEIVPDVVVNDLTNTRDDRVVGAAKKWLLE